MNEMYSTEQVQKARSAGKIAFLLAGAGIAPWASIMPFVKENLFLNELHYSILLLCFGIGAVMGMPLASPLSKKFGVRNILSFSFTALFLCVISISINNISYPIAAIIIIIWGASLGVSEVAANIHGTYIEELSKKHLLSGFHAFETIGCLFAAFAFPILLFLNLNVFYVSLIVCTPAILLSLYIRQTLLNTHGIREDKQDNNKISGHLPYRSMLIIAGFTCMLMYLCEGLVYDWSGVYLYSKCAVSLKTASLGYVAFQICVALMRLKGDKLVTKIGAKKLLGIGAVIAFSSLMLIANSNDVYTVITGFALLGLSVANVVPVIISHCAKNCGKDKARAISIVGTLGYTGVLVGPALLGFIASALTLDAIFSFTGYLMIVMGILSFLVLKKKLSD